MIEGGFSRPAECPVARRYRQLLAAAPGCLLGTLQAPSRWLRPWQPSESIRGWPLTEHPRAGGRQEESRNTISKRRVHCSQPPALEGIFSWEHNRQTPGGGRPLWPSGKDFGMPFVGNGMKSIRRLPWACALSPTPTLLLPSRPPRTASELACQRDIQG